MAHFLIVGLGQIGQELAQGLISQGHQVSAIRRGQQAPEQVALYAQDLLAAEAIKLPPQAPDVVYLIITPNERTRDAYEAAFIELPQRLFSALKVQYGTVPPIIFVSSTAVYGEVDGPVDESSQAEPTMFNGEVLLQAEQQLLAAAPATVVRFSGIYGPSRESRIRLAKQLIQGEKEAPVARWSSRIHSADVVGLLQHLGERWLTENAPPQVVVGTDNTPVVNLEVLNWLAAQLGEKLQLSWQQVAGRAVKSRYIAAGHYTLRYPSYQQGYAELVAAN